MYNSKEKGVYIGEWLRGQMNGLGILLYVDDEYYIGGWFKDQKHGLGVYQWGQSHGAAAGDKYEGYFKLGKAHGNGKTTYQDGGWHMGKYVDGKMHGLGMMKTSGGITYIGSWKEDELHGEIVAHQNLGDGAREVQIYNMGEYKGEEAARRAGVMLGRFEGVRLVEGLVRAGGSGGDLSSRRRQRSSDGTREHRTGDRDREAS
mmetsp:Transcript_39948/g.125488  ORF Transcript_39948/g.125488 Transcript_39948/m.125488 type:complete len:203 (+) Transcript_39948:742-1350(+)